MVYSQDRSFFEHESRPGHTGGADYRVFLDGAGGGKSHSLGLLAYWNYLQEPVTDDEMDDSEVDDFVPVSDAELEDRLSGLHEMEIEPVAEEIESLSECALPLVPECPTYSPCPVPEEASRLLRYFVNPVIVNLLDARKDLERSRGRQEVKVYMAFTRALARQLHTDSGYGRKKDLSQIDLFWFDGDPRISMAKRHAYADSFLDTLRQALRESMEHMVGQIIAVGYEKSCDSRQSLDWLISKATLFKTDVSPNGHRVLIFGITPDQVKRGHRTDVDRPQLGVMELPWEPQPSTGEELRLTSPPQYEWGMIRRAIEDLSRR
ncbi:hypothetical protein ABT169_17740 [Streptomyces sp. NPDC001616]|uniref:hypothetical protein n=1 Tax=Streptomyces sp. NPDC001616 TaxID=3156648 RepID=UPI003330432F